MSKVLQADNTRYKNRPNYTQACMLLQAIELNQRRALHPRCLAHLAMFVVKTWETDPCEEKCKELYQLLHTLLASSNIDEPSLEKSLRMFCQNSASTPTPCAAVTLLVAISYLERLNQKFGSIRGTIGCGARLISIAFLLAAQYMHDSLQLIIHVPLRDKQITEPVALPSPLQPTTEEQKLRISKLELEFLHLMDYDLSFNDPAQLVHWAHSFDTPPPMLDYCTSADEGDDEMDDDFDF
ncbi:hypothetical protein DM01DRAFT_1311485 [Hesseltinella vesiculosa]|uniref:Cyclin N-terminal domain-containing protein n=1 Tax=Hesseltinella vesiculosa TaxID=101127 RepID=A0A1X2G5Z3_9FUNG|nr:hypothetical protein DM01DRAFT_1311485 [Hesseltinella vesiculosa]